MNYNIILVAGCRHKGLPQFDSREEQEHAKKSWVWLITKLCSKIVFQHPLFGAVTAELTAEEAAELLQDVRVLSVEKSTKVKLQRTEQTPAPWHLSAIANRTDNVYDYDTAGEGVVVAIFDSGVDTTHPEFENRIMEVYTAYDGVPLDSTHGTHVAGIIGSKTYGVAKQCLMLSLRVMLDAGGQDIDVIDAISWLIINRDVSTPMVANFSLGGDATSESYFLETAILALINEGVTVCVAAGNDAHDVSLTSPARLEEVITVAAVDKSLTLASFTNFGTGIDISAPGVDITSVGLNRDIKIDSGTSMATPVVTGVVARVLSRQPEFTQSQVKAALLAAVVQQITLPADELYLAENALLPVELQIPEKIYSTTPTSFVNSFIPGKVAGAGIVTLPGINPLKNTTIVPYVVMDGVKIYGKAKTIASTDGPAIVQYNGIKTVKRIAALDIVPTAIAVSLPTMVANVQAEYRLIALSIDPNMATAYSINMGYSSGTFSFTTIGATPGAKQILSLQGLTGVVERLGSDWSVSSRGVTVEGRLLPQYVAEQVCVNLQERLDYKPYTTADIVQAISNQAGTNVSLRLQGLLYTSYQYTGRFIEALNSLAQAAGGLLVQQNGSWQIIPANGVYLGTFIAPIGDVISVSRDYQSDVKDTINSLLQARKSIDKELVTNEQSLAQLRIDLAFLVASMALKMPPLAVDTSKTMATAMYIGTEKSQLSTAVKLQAKSMTAAQGQQVTLQTLLYPMAADTQNASDAVQGVTAPLLPKTRIDIGVVELEFGKKSTWQPIAGTTLIEAPPWAWEYWLLTDDVPNKRSTQSSSLPVDYYQIVNAENDSYGRAQKKGLTVVDLFTEILIRVTLPSYGGILYAVGKLTNLGVNYGGWAGTENILAPIHYEVRSQQITMPNGLVTYENAYYISLHGTVNRTGRPLPDTSLYSASLQLTYVVDTPHPYAIDGKLTTDNYLIDAETSVGLGKLIDGTFYDLTLPTFGTYNVDTNTIANVKGTTVAIVDDQSNIVGLNGSVLGKLDTRLNIEAPIYVGSAYAKKDLVYDSVGNIVGDIVAESQAILALDIAYVPACVDMAGRVITFVDRNNRLVTKHNNRAVGTWANGVADICAIRDTHLYVSGLTGVEIFGLPLNTTLGEIVELKVYHVSNRVLGVITGNNVKIRGAQVGQIDYTGAIVTDAGVYAAIIDGGKIRSTGSIGHSLFTTVGDSDGLIGVIADQKDGIYDRATGGFVAAIDGTTVKSANGTTIGVIKESGTIVDANGTIAKITDGGQIMALKGYPFGMLAPGPTGSVFSYIIDNGKVVGRVQPVQSTFIPSGGPASASDLLNPAYAADGTLAGTTDAIIPGSYAPSSLDSDEVFAPRVNDYDLVDDSVKDPSVLTDAEADELERQHLKDSILAGTQKAYMLGANKNVLDTAIASYGAASLLPTLDSIAQIVKQLNDLQNPLVYREANPDKYAAKDVERVTFKAEQDLKGKALELQDKITAQESGLLEGLMGLTVQEEVVSCSFIYNNVLPLPANQFRLAGTLADIPATFGSVDSIAYSSGVVSVTTRRLITT